MGRLIDVADLHIALGMGVLCGNKTAIQVINEAPTVEAIPKDQYEARLKADMIAMLEEIKLKITEKSYYDTTIIGNYEDEVRINLVELDDVNEIIQDKINELKAESEDKENQDVDAI